MSRGCVTCTELVRSSRSNLLPGGNSNKGLWMPQGPMSMDEVILAVSGIAEPGSVHYRGSIRLQAQGISPSNEPISPRSATAGGCTAFSAACPQRAAPDWSQTAVARGATASPRSRLLALVKRRFRLRRQSDFQAAIGGKRVYTGRTLVAFAVPREADESRVGV